MLTQPHLLLNTPHSLDGEERRSVYTSQEQNAPLRLDSSSRISCLIFISSRFVFSVVLFVSRIPSLAVHSLIFSSSLSFFFFFFSTSSSNALPLFHLFSSSSLRHRRRRHGRTPRRRNVPIKSESHVLPISRQLNLVHAHIARGYCGCCTGPLPGYRQTPSRSTNPR